MIVSKLFKVISETEFFYAITLFDVSRVCKCPLVHACGRPCQSHMCQRSRGLILLTLALTDPSPTYLCCPNYWNAWQYDNCSFTCHLLTYFSHFNLASIQIIPPKLPFCVSTVAIMPLQSFWTAFISVPPVSTFVIWEFLLPVTW